jgi:hypothetical protein
VGKTFDQLRRAEAIVKGLDRKNSNCKFDNEISDQPFFASSEYITGEGEPTHVYQTINRYLQIEGLGVQQIKKKNLQEIKTALVMINAYMKKPESYLKFDLNSCLKKNGSEIVMQNIFSERKILLLERFSALVNLEKIKQIDGILDTIDDKKLREVIKKKLLQIVIKDQFVQKEYRSLK